MRTVKWSRNHIAFRVPFIRCYKEHVYDICEDAYKSGYMRLWVAIMRDPSRVVGCGKWGHIVWAWVL